MELQNETLVVLEEGMALDMEAELGCCLTTIAPIM